MGRSVSVPHNATCTAFLHLDHDHEDPDESFGVWEDFLDHLWHTLRAKYKSLRPDDRWVGREEKVHWSNDHADVVIADYCGLVSVSLVPKDRPYNDEASEKAIAEAWCDQVSTGFLDLINSTFGGLRKIGTASNGEAFFQAI
jgi:hypothetical protein